MGERRPYCRQDGMCRLFHGSQGEGVGVGTVGVHAILFKGTCTPTVGATDA